MMDYLREVVYSHPDLAAGERDPFRVKWLNNVVTFYHCYRFHHLMTLASGDFLTAVTALLIYHNHK